VVGVKAPDLLEDTAHAFCVPSLVEVLVLRIEVSGDVFHAHLASLQLLTERQELVNRDGRLEYDVKDAPPTILDALREVDLALSREKRERLQRAQVLPQRIERRGVIRGVTVGDRFAIGLGLSLARSVRFVGNHYIAFKRGASDD
jgi:hypothetical protein